MDENIKENVIRCYDDMIMIFFITVNTKFIMENVITLNYIYFDDAAPCACGYYRNNYIWQNPQAIMEN